ncbi:MAG: hypothetical protein QW767_02955 [Thermoprotei archaeon]
MSQEQTSFLRRLRASLSSLSLQLDSFVDDYLASHSSELSAVILCIPDASAVKPSPWKPTLTLSAVDGSFTRKSLDGIEVVVVSCCALSYELDPVSGWMERWPIERPFTVTLAVPMFRFQEQTHVDSEHELSGEYASELMRLLEYLTALRLTVSSDIVLRDGSFSSDYISLLRSCSMSHAMTNSHLIGSETGSGQIQQGDFETAIGVELLGEAEHSSQESASYNPPGKGNQIVFSNEYQEWLRHLEDVYPNHVESSHGRLTLSELGLSATKRVSHLLDQIYAHYLREDSHPMTFDDGRRQITLGLSEIRLLTALTITRLVGECRRGGRKALAIAKDSASNVFQQHVLREKASGLPDKLMLTLFTSVYKRGEYSGPWRTLDFDPLEQLETPRDLCVPPLEGLFKRFYYRIPTGDVQAPNVLACELITGPQPVLSEDSSEIPQLFHVLRLTSKPSSSIPEAIGHPFPLFEVDKLAKQRVREGELVVEGYAPLIRLDQKMAEYIRALKSFRAQREEHERQRRNQK